MPICTCVIDAFGRQDDPRCPEHQPFLFSVGKSWWTEGTRILIAPDTIVCVDIVGLGFCCEYPFKEFVTTDSQRPFRIKGQDQIYVYHPDHGVRRAYV
jgi:hypothetical protein